MLRVRGILLLLVVFVFATACQRSPITDASWPTRNGHPPAVIAHRGDSGNYPEHTLAGYRSALAVGADFIEPDIVLTRDGVPVCRHDLYLSATTDVASRPEYADRRRRLGNREDWFVIDFTLAELKTLLAVQHVRGRDRSHDGRFEVPTLVELITLVDDYNREHHTGAGLLVEIKSSPHYRGMGLDVAAATVQVVEQLADKGVRPTMVYQCFDRGIVERLASVQRRPVHWLSGGEIDLDNLPAGISGLGLRKDRIKIVDGRSPLIDAAHSLGLKVNCWTFRDDRMPDPLQGQPPINEIIPYLSAGVDGVITDYPATGVQARQMLQRRRK